MTHGLHGNEQYLAFKQFSFGRMELLLPALKINDDTIIYVLNIMGGHPYHLKTHAEDLIDGFSNIYNIASVNTIITPEGKSIPLAYEVANQLNFPYVVLRKCQKDYMKGKSLSAPIKTFTSGEIQALYLDNKDLNYIVNKNLLFVDDVISTGSTLRACERIVDMAGGKVLGCMAMATEGGYTPDIPHYVLCDLPIIKLDRA
jgi:adenine/guanine phosphoribosyltransferase-like PRPP-binding protein